MQRGGWGGSRGGYTMVSATNAAPEPAKRSFGFTGVDNAMALFVEMIRTFKDGGFAAVEASRQRLNGDDGAEGKRAFACGTDALARAQPEEGLADLAIMEALMESSRSGGGAVPVLQVTSAL